MFTHVLSVAVLSALIALPVGAQEDCFNDDPQAARNDLEPPRAPLPQLTVTEQDIAQMLAAIAAHEQRSQSKSRGDPLRR